MCGRRNPTCPKHSQPDHRCAGEAALFPYYLNSDQSVATALIGVFGAARIQRIHFNFGTAQVNANEWQEIARALERCRILAHRNANPLLGIYYWRNAPIANRTPNSFYMPPPNSGDFGPLAAHEGTHAIFDIHRRQVFGMESEASAYISQAMYWRIVNHPQAARWPRNQVPHQFAQAQQRCRMSAFAPAGCLEQMLLAALLVADQLLQGHRPTKAMLTDVESSVSNLYNMTKMYSVTAYDGI